MKDLDKELIEACRNCFVESAKLLIKAGADVNYVNEYGENALIHANAEISELLIDAGADVNAVVNIIYSEGNCCYDEDAEENITALIVAVKKKNTKKAKLLIDNGADVNVVGEYSVNNYNDRYDGKISKLLIDKISDVAVIEDLMCACNNGHYQIASTLLQN
jgi:ankyrin repeat protein